jgi:hypothetical protein
MDGDLMAIGGGKTLTIFLAADLKKFNTGMTQAQGGISGLAGSMKNMLGPAAIGAGIAVAGLATKLAIDGVKAAAEDEVSLAKLTQTLENLKLAHSTEEIDTFIDALEQSVGYLGDLRPAYDRLIRSTKDATAANDLLTLSLDVAQGTGKSVEAVAEALGKAYDGNTGALGRLGAGIDKATIASGDMNKITGVLAETFGGQATAQADTLNGRMQKLQRASEQLTEAFGKGLTNGLNSATGATDDLVKSMEDLEDEAETAGAVVAIVGTEAAKAGGKFLNGYANVLTFVKGLQNSNNTAIRTTALFNPLGAAAFLLGDGLDDAATAADAAGEAVGYTGAEARNAIPQWNNLTGAVRMSTQQYVDYLNAHAVGRNIIKNANMDYMDLAARQKVVNTFTHEYTGIVETANTTTGAASTAVEKLTKK